MYYHFSEDSSIEVFEPRFHQGYPNLSPAVWAIDAERSPMYLFPRDCPRIAFWARPDSHPDDVDRYLSVTDARMVIAVESRWLEKIRQARLYMYTFREHGFYLFDEGAGYYVTHQPVVPVHVEPVGDLLERLSAIDVELRITPSLQPLRDALPHTSLQYSLIRMRNAGQPLTRAQT